MHQVPGIKGIEHIGITVPDLKNAIQFFVEVLGCEHIYDIGPFQSSDNWMKEHLNVERDTTIPKISVLRCHQGSNLELFEYVADVQNKQLPKNSDLGGHHLTFYVEDIELALEAVRKNGLEVMGEITTMTEGSSAGERWVYFLSPWGLQLELISYPNGKAYEASTDKRLFNPSIQS